MRYILDIYKPFVFKDTTKKIWKNQHHRTFKKILFTLKPKQKEKNKVGDVYFD